MYVPCTIIYFGIIKVTQTSFEEVISIKTWILQRNKISFEKRKNDTGIIFRISPRSSTSILIPRKFCERATRINQAIRLSFTYLYHTLNWINVRKETKTVSTVQYSTDSPCWFETLFVSILTIKKTAGGNIFFHQVFLKRLIHFISEVTFKQYNF